MDFKQLIKRGLLGYQPIFFPNGVVTGAGHQFFGNLRQTAGSASKERTDASEIGDHSSNFATNDSAKFNQKRLGNLYVPSSLGKRADFDTDFYYCIDTPDLPQFVRDNVLLLEMYKYFVAKTVEISGAQECRLSSMIEIGSNTCLFPFAFAEAGLSDCHGADIVDYSDVVRLLSSLRRSHVSFHHMSSDNSVAWKSLPKTDLVWSYAVLLHQSNPLTHLTRLASLAKKAIFIMTPTESVRWDPPSSLGIQFLSANSYYAADFPNCFDVTVTSPALIRYSLQRLGFSRIVEIPPPYFNTTTPSEQTSLEHWMKQHCFLLGFRDEPASDDFLNDYSADPQRSPYKGEDVRVHRGYHHNIFLKKSRYCIVPHGKWIADESNVFKSFSCLGNAIDYLTNLPDERLPYPVIVAPQSDSHNLVRYRNLFYRCPIHGDIDFEKPKDTNTLHVLDSREKWEQLLSLIDETQLNTWQGQIVDLMGDICITRNMCGAFEARPILENAQLGDIVALSEVQSEVVGKILVCALRSSIDELANKSEEIYCHPDGTSLLRVSANDFHVLCKTTGSVISRHDNLEEAWGALVSNLTMAT